ncbi:MAG: tetratricopeptide repeat protein [Hyphomicrobiales bacterium]
MKNIFLLIAMSSFLSTNSAGANAGSVLVAKANDANSFIEAQSKTPIPVPSPEAEADRNAQKDRNEADARALEEAQRKASGNELPLLSEEREERLDQLFAILKDAKNEQLSQKAIQEIEAIWSKSGSDTIDLLVQWAGEATNNKEYGKALDFLDNVVRLKPDYAEGWNKRATVHFLNKDYGYSIADVERTLELEPRHFGALAGLSIMLLDYNEDARALEFMRRALEINPSLEHLKKQIETLRKEIEGRGA